MALENAPWAVDGAKHSGAVARTLAYASTSGAEGIVEPLDLRVRATQTPSGSVRVAPGGIAILNRAPNGGQQTYTARNVSETLVDVQPTGSGGGRTDYIWAHIVDPEYGGQFPDNPQTAQYFFLTASASQPEGNGWYRLARINIPASTATITQAMITDLREVAIPRRSEVVYARPRVIADDESGKFLTRRTTDGGEYFPGADWQNDVARIDIPEWATHMTIEATWMGVLYQGGQNVYGSYWVEFGNAYRPWEWPNNRQWEYSIDWFSFNASQSSNNQRINWVAMDSRTVPAKLRGVRNVAFAFKAGLHPDADTGISVDYTGGLGLRVTFAEVAINEDTV